MKQAPRACFGKFSRAILEFGMARCQINHSVFYIHEGDKWVLLVVYVDDIILTSNDLKGIEEMKHFLSAKFLIKNLGQLRYFLGINMARSVGGISLSQRKYTL